MAIHRKYEAGTPVNITSSGLVKAGSGALLGIFVASGTPTIKVWDSATASGAVIVNTFQTVAATFYRIPATFAIGCFITITGVSDITAFLLEE